MKAVIALAYVLAALSCRQPSGLSQKVELLPAGLCTDLLTEYTTNHQGEHRLNDCFVYTNNDTLYISLPAKLPAYWLGAELSVADGLFNATVNGVPFIAGAELTHRIKKQRLCLNKRHYAVGDTLHAYVELVFEERDDAQDYAQAYYLKGCLHRVVRTIDYDPFEDDEAILSYNLGYAVNVLGDPLSEEVMATRSLTGYRTELLDIFPPSDSIYICELTWNTSHDEHLSDGGIDRLTVWYAQHDKIWRPVRLLRWNADTEF